MNRRYLYKKEGGGREASLSPRTSPSSLSGAGDDDGRRRLGLGGEVQRAGRHGAGRRPGSGRRRDGAQVLDHRERLLLGAGETARTAAGHPVADVRAVRVLVLHGGAGLEALVGAGHGAVDDGRQSGSGANGNREMHTLHNSYPSVNRGLPAKKLSWHGTRKRYHHLHLLSTPLWICRNDEEGQGSLINTKDKRQAS